MPFLGRLVLLCLGTTSALHHSKLLALRGGGASSVLSAPPAAQDAPPAAVQLKVTAGTPSQADTPRVEIGSAAFGALQLKAGDRVRVRKMKRAALWSNIADQTVGTAVEAPELDDSSVRVLTADVSALRLKMGENVMVAPVLTPSVAKADGTTAAATPTETIGEARHYRRRSGMSSLLWYRMMFGPTYYGGGYGRRTYGSRTYGGSRRSYGGYSRRGGGMGGRRR